MDRFSKYNPKASLLFFASVIILTMLIFNPVYLSLSLAGGLLYSIKLKGKGAAGFLFKLVLPLILLVAAFNMLFVHTGETVLFSLLDTSFTAESLFYGFNQGVMLGAVILWFSCYNSTVTAEGLMSAFGKRAPNIALVFSMVLTFIPRLKKNLAEIEDARMLADSEKSKMKKALNNLSALVSMTLEESIETADSMKARGFVGKRNPYSKYCFSNKDLAVMLFCALSFAAVIAYKAAGKTTFIFEPIISMPEVSFICITVFAVLCLLPLIIDFAEDIKWFYLKQKI